MATAQNRGKWMDYLYTGGLVVYRGQWAFRKLVVNYLLALAKLSVIFGDIYKCTHYSIRFMGMLGKFIIINYIFRSVCMCVLVYCVVIL